MAAAAVSDDLPELVEAALIALFNPKHFQEAYAAWRAKQENASAERYYANVVPIDRVTGVESDEDSPAWESDGGLGVRRLEGALDGDGGPGTDRRILTAIQRTRRNAPHCVKTLRLILRNRNDREKSICELACES